MKPNLSRTISISAIAIVGLMVASASASAAPRLALVIGNERYEDAALKHPVADARLVKDALGKCGFTVTGPLENADRVAMDKAVREFAKQAAAAKPEAVVLYYSGHGVSSDNQPYLLPVGTTYESPADVTNFGIPATWVVDKLTEAGAEFTLAVLDACRNAPFTGQKGLGQGLGMVASKGLRVVGDSPGGGYAILYATQPDSTAQDNGLLAKAFADSIRQPHGKAVEALMQVRAIVSKESAGKQVPRMDLNYSGAFTFVHLRPQVTGQTPPSPKFVGDPLAHYAVFLKDLDRKKIESVETAAAKLEWLAEGRTEKEVLALLNSFATFRDECMKAKEKIVFPTFDSRKRFRYQESAREEAVISAAIAKAGWQIDDNGEGRSFVKDAGTYFQGRFARILPFCLTKYYNLLAVESQRPPSEDAAIVISWDEIWNRLGNWEAYLSEYPESPMKNAAGKHLLAYVRFFVLGDENTPACGRHGNATAKVIIERFLERSDASKLHAFVNRWYKKFQAGGDPFQQEEEFEKEARTLIEKAYQVKIEQPPTPDAEP